MNESVRIDDAPEQKSSSAANSEISTSVSCSRVILRAARCDAENTPPNAPASVHTGRVTLNPRPRCAHVSSSVFIPGNCCTNDTCENHKTTTESSFPS